jgi:hypothetical protein
VVRMCDTLCMENVFGKLLWSVYAQGYRVCIVRVALLQQQVLGFSAVCAASYRFGHCVWVRAAVDCIRYSHTLLLLVKTRNAPITVMTRLQALARIYITASHQ